VHIRSCPKHVSDRLLELTDAAAALEEDAKAAAAKLEKLRAIVNQRTTTTHERWQEAKLEFDALLPSVPKLQKRAKDEQAIVDGCKAYIAALDDHATLAQVRTMTSGYGLDQVRTQIGAMGVEILALRRAETPTDDIEQRVRDYYGAFPEPIPFGVSAGTGPFGMKWPAADANPRNGVGYDTLYASDALRMNSWLLRELLVEKTLELIDRLARKPLPVAQRPARIAELEAQRLQLFHLEARLCDEAIARGEFVTRLADSPPACVLGIVVKVPQRLNERRQKAPRELAVAAAGRVFPPT